MRKNGFLLPPEFHLRFYWKVIQRSFEISEEGGVFAATNWCSLDPHRCDFESPYEEAVNVA